MKISTIAILVAAFSHPLEATNDQAVLAIVNKAAQRNGTCSLEESTTLQVELLEPINTALVKYGFQNISGEAGSKDGDRRRLGADACDWCINRFTPFQCNSWLNCNFRRNLRSASRPKGDILGLDKEWKATCHDLIDNAIVTHAGNFSDKCQAALKDAECITATLD